MRELNISQRELPGKIGGIPLFAGLSKEAFADFAKAGRVVVYERNEDVVTEGIVSEEFGTVISGKLDVVVRAPSGEEVSLATISDGAFTGEECCLFGKPAVTTIRAKGEAALFALPKGFLLPYISENPKTGLVVLTCTIMDLMKKLQLSNEALATERMCFVSSEELESLHKILPFTMQDIMPGAAAFADGLL